jgi:hypothetical protein
MFPLNDKLVCFTIRNIFMALRMICPHILILQILVICLSIELGADRKPRAQHCQLGQSLLQIRPD